MGNRWQPSAGLLSCLVAALASSSLAQTTTAAAAASAATPAVAAAAAVARAPNYTSLNTTLGGTLQRGVPLAEACYGNYAGTKVAPNPAQCSSVQSNYESELFIESNFGGYENANWAMCQSMAQGCSLNFTNPLQPVASSSVCYQGSVPSYYIPGKFSPSISSICEYQLWLCHRLGIMLLSCLLIINSPDHFGILYFCSFDILDHPRYRESC
jgi:hypothetical protein